MTKTCQRCKTKNEEARSNCILCKAPLGCSDNRHIVLKNIHGLNFCPDCGDDLSPWDNR